MDRAPGLSVRLKLTLSYAGFLMLAGVLLLAVVWLFLLRYVPDVVINRPGPTVPNQSDLVRAFAPRAAAVLAFLLVFGLVGGWILAGRMLSPLTRITVSALRKRLGAPWVIATVPGVGYRIDAAPGAGYGGGNDG